MSRTIFLLVLIGVSFMAKAQQTAKEEILYQIDSQIWMPFQESFTSGDATAFNALHTDDVLRITGNEIRIGEEYKNQIRDAYNNPDRSKRTIEFAFEQRTHRDSIAYEVGMYKITLPDSGREFYGRFHVVLKKTNGTWKIAQDWDAEKVNGNPVAKEDFERLQQ